MSGARSSVAIAAAVGAMSLGTGAARAGEPTTKELMEQIQQLQAKVNQLEARQQQSITSADVNATVESVLRDADRRSQLLAAGGGISSNWRDGHFVLESEDGNFSLMPGGLFQFRSVSNWDTSGDDSFENGFEVTRAKVNLQGHVFSPDMTYKFQAAFSRTNGTPRLEDAWVRYRFADDWAVRMGQFINPVVHEQLMPAAYQLAAERSLLNVTLTGESENYVQGVTLIYDPGDKFRAEFGFTDGIGSSDTTWRDFPAGGTNWGVAGRVEYLVYGDRKDYDSFSARNNATNLLVIGAGGDITQAGSDTAILHTVDAQWENNSGWAVYGAFLGQQLDLSGADQYNWGLLAQAGYMFRPDWEGFARWDYIKLDGDVVFDDGSTEDSFHEFTVGVNYYMHGYSAKFTLDASYLPNGSPSEQTGLGYLAGSDDQFAVRAQFQLVL